ncbi:MAG: transglutaminase-like domain-containing protein [Halioglobus sp.]
MKRIVVFIALLLCMSLAQASLSKTRETREFTFTYEVQDADYPVGQAVDLYVPAPALSVGQEVLAQSINSSTQVIEKKEAKYGNRYYHLRREAGDTTPLTATFEWTVSREVVTANGSERLGTTELEPFLVSNRLVPVGHKILQPILAEIHAARKSASKPDTARAIYDWVVDNVEYKKVGTGWGNGDTFWACSERYGNCTDFHALFTALARSEGIPSRFEIGFPVPLSRNAGKIGGYHCWVQFYLPGEGWVPIDASEAAKHPEQRELLYGSHPMDRIHFTTGRDLQFTQATQEKPLNYFVYPYVEIEGKAWTGKVPTQFRYAEPLSQSLQSSQES